MSNRKTTKAKRNPQSPAHKHRMGEVSGEVPFQIFLDR